MNGKYEYQFLKKKERGQTLAIVIEADLSRRKLDKLAYQKKPGGMN
jgi:hypothetical protein